MKTARARVLIYSTADRYWRRESGLPATYKQEEAVQTTNVKNSSERNKTVIQEKVDSPLLTSKSRLFEQRMSRIHPKETKQRSRGKWTPHYLQARAGCSNNGCQEFIRKKQNSDPGESGLPTTYKQEQAVRT